MTSSPTPADSSIVDTDRPVDRLRTIMRRLRDPDEGCPWDIEQDFASIAPQTVEEAYEVADAIERGDLEDLKDELGDLLLHVVFHARMAEEQGVFDFDDVAQAIVEKLIRRHPHVFGNDEFVDMASFKAGWETAKAEERVERARRRQTGVGDESSPNDSALDGVPRNLPALTRASKLQKRAARVGFDWPKSDPVWDKLDEEIGEARDAESDISEDGDKAALTEELGDILFTVVNIARRRGIDAEVALSDANRKFDRRFRQVESFAAAAGSRVDELELEALDSLWERAKRVPAA